MKILTASVFAALMLSPLALRTASACNGDSKCQHGAAGSHSAQGQAVSGKAQKVALEGRVVTEGCPMDAAAKQCTGAALVVGEQKHMIKKTGKGSQLAKKFRDSDKVVKVTGTTKGEFLTVAAFEIKS